MSSLDELAFLDATAQADLVRRNEVAPLELVSGCADVRMCGAVPMPIPSGMSQWH